MTRLILRLFGISDFEPCKSCETLKQQLAYAVEEKKLLTQTLLDILQPKVVEAPPVEINPIVNTSGTFARRRAALEARDREEAKIRATSTSLGKSDRELEIAKLEKELDVEEKETT